MPIQSGEITNTLLVLLTGWYQHYLGGPREESINVFAQLHPHLFGAVHKVRYLHYSGANLRLVPIVPINVFWWRMALETDPASW